MTNLFSYVVGGRERKLERTRKRFPQQVKVIEQIALYGNFDRRKVEDRILDINEIPQNRTLASQFLETALYLGTTFGSSAASVMAINSALDGDYPATFLWAGLAVPLIAYFPYSLLSKVNARVAREQDFTRRRHEAMENNPGLNIPSLYELSITEKPVKLIKSHQEVKK